MSHAADARAIATLTGPKNEPGLETGTKVFITAFDKTTGCYRVHIGGVQDKIEEYEFTAAYELDGVREVVGAGELGAPPEGMDTHAEYLVSPSHLQLTLGTVVLQVARSNFICLKNDDIKLGLVLISRPRS